MLWACPLAPLLVTSRIPSDLSKPSGQDDRTAATPQRQSVAAIVVNLHPEAVNKRIDVFVINNKERFVVEQKRFSYLAERKCGPALDLRSMICSSTGALNGCGSCRYHCVVGVALGIPSKSYGDSLVILLERRMQVLCRPMPNGRPRSRCTKAQRNTTSRYDTQSCFNLGTRGSVFSVIWIRELRKT